MFQLEVAGLVLNVDCDNKFVQDRINGFISQRFQDDGVNISIYASDYIETPSGMMIADESIKWRYKPSEQEGYFLYTTEIFYNQVLCLLDVDHQWKNATITYLDYQNNLEMAGYKNRIETFTHLMIGLVFQNYLLHYEGIVVHASSLEWKGKGIIFSAPSGTGKSTHVKLWQECFDSEVKILNDDTPAVRFQNGCPLVFGTPWSGSANLHYNGSAPLSAIVLLQQSSDNSIEPISNQEAIARLMPRVFLPYYDKVMMNKACDVFERIISMVPVYLLKCRPDREAVELVCQWVK